MKLKAFFGKYKAYIAFALCLVAALSSGYMIQKRSIENDLKNNKDASETQAFITDSEEALPEDVGETITVLPEERVIPEAFPDSEYETEPLVTEESLEAAKTNVFSPSAPVKGTISKAYSKEPLYSKTLGDWRSHEGIDISADEGEAVAAADGGEVISVGKDALLGIYVKVKHFGGFETVYANLHSEITVAEGQQIKKGHVLGYVGSTSISEQSDEPHLHFEIISEQKRVNPSNYIK